MLQIFLLLFIVTHIPYFLPALTHEQLTLYNRIQTSVFLLPFSFVLLWPRRKDAVASNERAFWLASSGAFFLWWIASLIHLAGSWEPLTGSAHLVTDSLYFFYYLSWFLALSFLPHVQDHQSAERSNRWLLGAGTAVLAICLFFFFILLPSWATPENYETWVPSLLFYSGLDIVLVVWLLRLVRNVRTPRWRRLYGILLTVAAGLALLDLLEASHYSENYRWGAIAESDIIWSLPFLGVAVFARARYFRFPASAQGIKASVQAPDPAPILTSPIAVISLVMPVLYIGMEALGLVQGDLRRAQGLVVLGSLVGFWVLAVLENRSLRRITRMVRVQTEELERLRIAQQVGEKAQLARAQFLANVSHEIRTPMNGILGMSEILLLGKLDSKQRGHAELVYASAQGLLEVMDDILEYSKLEAGEISIVNAPFDLKKVAGQVLDLTRIASEQKNLQLQLELPDDVPHQLIGDPSRLRQVLLNLLVNAIKFTDAGEVRVRFSLAGLVDTQARVRCEVIDSGIGIRPDQTDYLFLPFTQGDETTTRTHGGSGLGLAISKQIVEAQHGKIGVNRNPGGGSRFWFELPFTITPVEATGQGSGPQTVPVHIAGRRILLAEDNPANQRLATTQLAFLGQLEVDVVSNGYEVLEALRQHSYRLLLMDCQMPGLDGIETTRRIRAQGYSRSSLPIIALTAHAFDADRDRCLAAGMDDYLSKPVSLERLRTILTTWLDQNP